MLLFTVNMFWFNEVTSTQHATDITDVKFIHSRPKSFDYNFLVASSIAQLNVWGPTHSNIKGDSNLEYKTRGGCC